MGSLASVVMPEFVVDGDLCHEIDGREIPAAWVDGFVPIGKSAPYEEPLAQRFNGEDGICFGLDAGVNAERAFEIGAGCGVDGYGGGWASGGGCLRRRRRLGGAPEVLRGDELSSTTFWHGRLMSERARRWVAYQTGRPWPVHDYGDGGCGDFDGAEGVWGRRGWWIIRGW